ncbi:hypothetical protein [Trichococcus pasteurii]|uniref:Uncharacterized protein n=1 Tax=Trichococcus pasteurii TaxID=43064 RepID=A0A1W1ICU1_9LACT|nr:hypothetical protein [Trichococcus pasteurii]SFE37581.1 hypothetical protein SAMN04488086_10364 [Trichococcus pasteurii]SLM50844.1 Hypothetical protein TPAS_516 [Trichococcus pasteurii]SSB91725.1 Hypothetical protein TPAS_516 [Trichococcus pasteurii]
MINHEEEKFQAAYKESVMDSTQEVPLTEEEAYAKEKILEHYDDKEEGTLVFTQAMAEAAADAILKAESYIYNTRIEKHEKVVNTLGEQAQALSNEFSTKKEAILNRNEYTDVAKAERLNDLYDEYEKKMKAIMGEQYTATMQHQKDRREKAQQALDGIVKKASINDFDAKDMTYITYMLDHGSNDEILSILKEYKFHPHLLKMVNARDRKKPLQYDAKGRPMDNRLSIKHPLQMIAEEQPYRPNTNTISVALGDSRLQRTLTDMIPTAGIPKKDAWSFQNLEGAQRDKNLRLDPWGMPY